MANARRQYSEAEQVSLNTQVGGYCPLCDKPLFYHKNDRTYKGYELAHIYPLNPSKLEIVELLGVAQLHSDVNHPDNLIPLCESCHSKFDKPRTLIEYNKLFNLKKELISREQQHQLAAQYPLETQISAIVARLNNACLNDLQPEALQFDPKKLVNKFDSTIPGPTKRKIKNAVSDYYLYVQDAFRELEKSEPYSSTLIFLQIKTFYTKQKTLGYSQLVIFTNIVNWIQKSTDAETLESAEIVASFFVQNCEVFE